MAGGIPDKDRRAAREIGNLLVKQPVIGSQPRQKDQRRPPAFGISANPIMDVPPGGWIDLFRQHMLHLF